MKTPIETIEIFIAAKMAAQHKGKKNAITRHVLIKYLREYVDPDITYRDMDKAKETLPTCGGKTGIYLPADEEERDSQIRRYESWHKAIGMNIKRLKELNIPPQSKQQDLFEEGQ